MTGGPSPGAPALADKEVRLSEFTALRQEIVHRATVQQALMAANLALIAALVGIVVAAESPEPQLLLIVPVVASALGLLWVDQHAATLGIASYLRNELWMWDPCWERRIFASPSRFGRVRECVFWFSVWLLFCGVSIGAFAIGEPFQGPDTARALSALGSVLTVVANGAVSTAAVLAIRRTD